MTLIDNIDFCNLEAERYWTFPKSYKGDSKKETKNMFMSNDYLCSCKMDGHYARLIKDLEGNIKLQGRTKSVDGDYLDKHEWVPQLNEFFSFLPKGTVLLGELFFPNKRGSRNVTTILGCLKDKALERQEKGDKLFYYVFDVWAYDGVSYLNKTMEERVKTLNKLAIFFGQTHLEQTTNVMFAHYYRGEKAWEELNTILSSGGEGMVITRANSKPEPGKRTARKTLKVKMEIENHIDAFLDGGFERPTRLYTGKDIENWCYWENCKTGERSNENMFREYSEGRTWEPITRAYYNDWASAVSFSLIKDGKTKRIGWIAGIPDELKAGIVQNPDDWIGKVAELSAMEVEKSGDSYTLRHGKIVQWRDDKKREDCEWSQIE